MRQRGVLLSHRSSVFSGGYCGALRRSRKHLGEQASEPARVVGEQAIDPMGNQTPHLGNLIHGEGVYRAVHPARLGEQRR